MAKSTPLKKKGANMCKNCDAWNDYRLEEYLKEDEEEEPLPEPEEYEDYDDEEGVYIP